MKIIINTREGAETVLLQNGIKKPTERQLAEIMLFGELKTTNLLKNNEVKGAKRDIGSLPQAYRRNEIGFVQTKGRQI